MKQKKQEASAATPSLAQQLAFISHLSLKDHTRLSASRLTFATSLNPTDRHFSNTTRSCVCLKLRKRSWLEFQSWRPKGNLAYLIKTKRVHTKLGLNLVASFCPHCIRLELVQAMLPGFKLPKYFLTIIPAEELCVTQQVFFLLIICVTHNVARGKHRHIIWINTFNSQIRWWVMLIAGQCLTGSKAVDIIIPVTAFHCHWKQMIGTLTGQFQL